MIIAKLIGGLGNQMFQYAAARRLAFIRDACLKLDLSIFNTEQKGLTRRHFELGCFDLQYKIASPIDLLFVENNQGVKKQILRLLWKRRDLKLIVENQFHFDPEILDAPDNVCLAGHWISEKYFIDIKDILRKEFTFKLPQEMKDANLEELISSSMSVGVHVRRGDYVSDPEINRAHGVCGQDYYVKAMDIIEKKIDSPRYIVFSDDISWAKQNLRSKHDIVFVDYDRNKSSYEDMRLMSMCKHNIIANSTYSWWSAWLNTNPDKIIIAPEKWFNNKNADTRDLFPEGWVKI